MFILATALDLIVALFRQHGKELMLMKFVMEGKKNVFKEPFKEDLNLFSIPKNLFFASNKRK